MLRPAILLTLAAALMMPASAQIAPLRRSEGAGTLLRGTIVAREVLAAERAFDERAASEGQWTAFRATAAPDAVMFVPQRVNARQWLAGRADPPRSVRWQPHGVFVSCDGQTATTYGYAQWPDGSFGRFRTIWQRQPDGRWSWVLDTGWPTTADRPAPAEPEILIANCLSPPPPGAQPARHGSSPDNSLRWHEDVDANGRGTLSIHGWNGRFFHQLSSDSMGPPR